MARYGTLAACAIAMLVAAPVVAGVAWDQTGPLVGRHHAYSGVPSLVWCRGDGDDCEAHPLPTMDCGDLRTGDMLAATIEGWLERNPDYSEHEFIRVICEADTRL